MNKDKDKRIVKGGPLATHGEGIPGINSCAVFAIWLPLSLCKNITCVQYASNTKNITHEHHSMSLLRRQRALILKSTEQKV